MSLVANIMRDFMIKNPEIKYQISGDYDNGIQLLLIRCSEQEICKALEADQEINMFSYLKRLCFCHKKYIHSDEDKFKEWAFGPNWEKLGDMEKMHEWNKKHSDLFILWGSDNIGCSLYDMRKAYKQRGK